MADLLKNLQGVLGGAKSSVSSAASADDFADFATAASPQAPSHAASSAFDAASTVKPVFGAGMGLAGRPYTKWYRVWERVTIADFYQELAIIPILIIVILVNIWGAAANKRRAKQWAKANLATLESEYASVGMGGRRKTDSALSSDVPNDFYKEQSKYEYISYATGRQNVAWLDIKLSLYKRYNPVIWFGEAALSFFMDSFAPPVERLEATAYAFDGKEKSLVPMKSQGSSIGTKDSAYDGFVFAIVHKDKMKQLRVDRYDLSLTSTKDHPKLPHWATVMSEGSEITEAMLTPELVKAVTDAGESLEALIISDQPIDAPKKLNDTIPKKRVYLAMRIDNTPANSNLFAIFLRLPDHLVTSAHFRAEAMRKMKATREEEQKKLRKIDEEEKAEERRIASEKLKKEERDRKLSKMSADEQRKFLEKEKEKQQRKGMKKQTQRG